LRLIFAIAMVLVLAGCERKVSVKLSVKTRDAGLMSKTSTASPR
jgi:hypothetical protein